MRVYQNVIAMNAHRALSGTQDTVTKATERLSSGLRINRAADDASGLAISESLRTQINGLHQAERNANDGISLIKTAEGNLNETHAILQRMRSLAVQAANGTNSPENLRQIQAEMMQSMAQIDQIADSTQFNGMALLDGTFIRKALQIGANAGDTTEVTIGTRKTELIAGEPAGIGLWNLDLPEESAKLPAPLVVSHTLETSGETLQASVRPAPLPAWPNNASAIVETLNGNSDFSAHFEARLGDYLVPGEAPRYGVNVVIMAKEPGKGAVDVSGSSSLLKVNTASGKDEIPEEWGGYHAAELLEGALDVTKVAGTETIFVPYRPATPPQTIVTEDLGNRRYHIISAQSAQEERWETRTIASGATEAIGLIDRAIERVSRGRAELGAQQNALEHTVRNVSLSAENQAVAESRIRDADMAEEMVELTRGQILQQAAHAMLAQANQSPQTVLKLIG